ncbi:MAG: SUMF1/EgtB/PvdO family nonheme iron enzyme [Thermoanaerobaculia bacterium]
MSETQRQFFLDWFRAVRRRSRELFAMIPDSSYHERPIPLRHPIVFYDGHLPAFNVNTLAKKGHGAHGIDEELEMLFERGIDPGDTDEAALATIQAWPERGAIARYGERADALVERFLAEEPLERDDRAAMRRGEAIWTILEHEAMHHETLLYIFHALDPAKKTMPQRGIAPPPGDGRDARTTPARVRIPAGTARLGATREEIQFGWDNELEAVEADVPSFEIDATNVTNREFLEFVDAGGYGDPELWSEEAWRWIRAESKDHPHFWVQREGRWLWRGMRGEIDLPPDWPVWVTHAEAEAYARWSGARLPTEAEYHRAAFGTPEGRERRFPWGNDQPRREHGNFDLQSWDPLPVGSFPAGRSAWGVDDLVGNGWEWTATPFAPFEGFRPMPSYPQYSADFFDGAHYVMKGASPATPKELVRRSFRNWFRPNYLWVWAAFRTVR